MALLASANANVARNAQAGHSRHASMLGLQQHHVDHVFGGMSMNLNQRGLQHGLGKLDTLSGADLENGLRTAPPLAFGHEFDFENFAFGSSSTINPNALHYNDSPSIDRHSPFGQMSDLASAQMFEDSLDWVNGFEQHMNIQGNSNNENAIDGSSPSAISTTSQSGMSDVMVDGSNHPAPAGTSAMWQPSVMGPPQLTNPFAMDLNGSVFPDLLNGAPVSPQPASQKINDPYFSTPPTSLSSLSPTAVSGLKTQTLNQPNGFHAGPDLPSPLPTGNNGASPVTTITEITRTAIVNTLSSTQLFSGRKAPTGPSSTTGSSNQFKVPNVPDLQRFVGAYLKHFHPHFPFLHIPTLSFDLTIPSTDEEGGVGGRGCLLLGIAMIGALYEKDDTQSKDMFDLAKKMIFLFLEERRKAEMSRASETRRSVGPTGTEPSQPDDGSDTPLWLVQAMLLNVAYGHNVSDKIATDIASTHCTALVSLAQAAGLQKQIHLRTYNTQDTHMADDGAWGDRQAEYLEHVQWIEWKIMEERKRTLYAVFIMSSLLVTAYNHAPALTNSEITVDLPCDEEFYAAESATAFFAKGGARAASHNVVPFCDALGELLRSNERSGQQNAPLGNPAAVFTSMPDQAELSMNKLKPSSFGCLLLINALHNFIWETRQRHQNKVWTNEETEKMHRHIEPALRAWQVAWASNPHHHHETPNPYGLGPLSADAIPLLDLAYVRLFIELARAKERFWERDWEGLSNELAKGSHATQHADSSPESSEDSNETESSDKSTANSAYANSPATQGIGMDGKPMLSGGVSAPGERVATRREKHLRKASFFAADSLAMSGKLGTSLADHAEFDLPLQAALCSFECLQILAEWVATLQDRVGRYLGILGKDKIDLGSMPAVMVLEDDDVKLLEKVQTIVEAAETKIKMQLAANGMSADQVIDDSGGYCPKLMRLMGMVMEKAGVWQVYHLMAQCLAAQSVHARLRAEKSVQPAE